MSTDKPDPWPPTTHDLVKFLREFAQARGRKATSLRYGGWTAEDVAPLWHQVNLLEEAAERLELHSDTTTGDTPE